LILLVRDDSIIVPTLSKNFPGVAVKSVARALQAIGGMRYANSRRCPLWVSPRAFVVAEELAHSIGLDVDTFIESTVLALREHEASEGRPGARDAAVEKGRVILMADRRGRLRRSDE
jgi:hypothetical protein